MAEAGGERTHRTPTFRRANVVDSRGLRFVALQWCLSPPYVFVLPVGRQRPVRADRLNDVGRVRLLPKDGDEGGAVALVGKEELDSRPFELLRGEIKPYEGHIGEI